MRVGSLLVTHHRGLPSKPITPGCEDKVQILMVDTKSLPQMRLK